MMGAVSRANMTSSSTGLRISVPAEHPDDTGPSIFSALTHQLGLRLKSTKGPVQVYVIEKIEHPSEN